MAFTFDATLKDLARDCPEGLLSRFDRPPAAPIKLLNVDLSAVSRSADLIVGIGEPMQEIVHIEFQTSAAPWKHADVLVYNALLFSQQRVPVHSVAILLRPEAAHANLTGRVRYAPRPERGNMDFGYQVVRLWEIEAEQFLMGDVGLTPLAVLGRLPEGVEIKDGLATIARRIAERLSKETSSDRAGKLLARALLLSGLRVRRNVAFEIFQGVHMMEESDTFLAILERGEERGIRGMILMLGEDRFGPADESVRAALNNINDLDRLRRMGRATPKAASWQELLATP
ncbi:MAG TPA: hypothetical protein VG826_18100 [Pirellulales bacterium]|nr:hypothetical protein [Pirellulales bacterium]